MFKPISILWVARFRVKGSGIRGRELDPSSQSLYVEVSLGKVLNEKVL